MKIVGLRWGILLAVFLLGASVLGLAEEVEVSEEPNEKAARYHSLLLKRPGNATVFGRFVDAWLDSGTKEGLKNWLRSGAEEGAAAEWRVLGALHQYLGEDEEALKALNEAVQRDGKSGELRLARAKLQARLLAFEAALKDLELALKDEKMAIEAAKLKGMYLARSGQVEEAVKAWKGVITAYPKDENLREDLIEVEVMEGLYEDAIETSRGLVKMTKDPYKKALRRLRLGDIEVLAGEREAGLRTYEAILSASGEGTWLEREVLAQVERVFLKEDDLKGLRDFYQSLREKHPQRVSIRKVLARQMALNDEMEEAIALFREVMRITPGDLGNREEFVAFLETHERWEEAKEELELLLGKEKGDAVLWERLSRVEAKLGNEEGLKVALEKLTELKSGTAEGVLASVNLYEQAELKVEAEAILRAGRERFSESLELAEGLAIFLIQNNKELEALEIWKKLAEGADREGLLRVARSLSGQGKVELAFELLSKRVGEFENDSLVLAQYCKLANSEEEATRAIPQGIALVNEAASASELETAVRTVLRLVARSGQGEEVSKNLAKDKAASVASLCLLSAIYQEQGDSRKASETLERAASQDGGILARFYRVSFEEERGEIQEAIKVMREIIETPEGRKTVHLRRLVDLLEWSGDYEKALVAVDEWKRMAPGDHAAWKRRAKLLQASGKSEAAVMELRRMIGKFGAEEQYRAELAGALLLAAEFTQAQRIYEQLYSESENLETKLKWASEMAQLARREGRLEDLLEDFEGRKRSNPSSVAPVLAIAEIHRVLDQYEERRSALLEASRRRPEDTQLLARIAEVEERAGEFDRAVGILRDAVKLDKTVESKKRLSKLLFKTGEVQAGLDLLNEMPTVLNDPRGLEEVVQALIRAEERGQALKVLERYSDQHLADWRLRYLYGMALNLDGQDGAALEIFTELLRGGDEIRGLKPLLPPVKGNQNLGPWKVIFDANGWSELVYYQRFIATRASAQSGRSAAVQIALPGTPRELQILSLLQAGKVLNGLTEGEKKEGRSLISLPGIKEVELLTALMSGEQALAAQMLKKRLEESPDDPGLFTLSLLYKGESGGISLEDFEKAKSLLLADYPGAFGVIAFTAMQNTELSAEMIAEVLGKSVDSLDQEEGAELMELMSSYVFSGFGYRVNNGNDLDPLKDLMSGWVIKASKRSKNWRWMPRVVPHLLAGQKNDEVILLINRFCEWEKQDRDSRQVGRSSNQYGFGGTSPRGRYLVNPAFPPPSLKGVPRSFLSLFPIKARKTGEESGGAERQKLLAQLQLENEGGGGLGENLSARIPEIENLALRALAYLSLGKEEEGAKLIEGMLESREESLLLFCAGYFSDREDPRAYEALLRARNLSLSRELRKQVDGHLAMLGSSLAGRKDLEIDLEPAQRAALRLRRVAGFEERDELADTLVKLGLKNEAQRLSSTPKSPPTRAIPGGTGSKRQVRERITELHKAGNLDGAAREAAKQFRVLSSQRGNDWELRQLAEKLTTRELKEETLKKLDPGESESRKRILEFARAQEIFGTREKARKSFEKILAKDADHIEALVGAIRNTPFSELDESRIIIRKDGKIDVEASGEVFGNLWENAGSSELGLEHYLQVCELTALFLERLPPSEEADRNLSWVPYHILDFAKERYLGNKNLSPLVARGERNSYGREQDEEASQKRNDAARAVFLKMIKHPQIAEQGFMLLEASKESLNLGDDELVQIAQTVVEKIVQKEKMSERISSRDLWAKYYRGGSIHSEDLAYAKDPITWLLSYDAKKQAGALTPEIFEKLKKHDSALMESLGQARKIAEAQGSEAERLYLEWKEGLPEQTVKDAVTLAKMLLLFSPEDGAWADDLESLLLSPKSPAGIYNLNQDNETGPQLIMEWAKWRLETGGAVACDKFLLRVYESAFGPSEKWGILAQLGEDSLPQKYKQASYSIHKVNHLLLTHPGLVRPALLFLSKYPLRDFVYQLEDAITEAWSPSYASAEVALRVILANQMLQLGEDEEEPSLEQFIAVAEGVKGISFSNSREERAELSDLLLKEKDLNSDLQKLAAASLREDKKGREMIQPFLEKNIKFVEKLIERHPAQSLKILRGWFPEMGDSKVSAPLREVLGSFSEDARVAEVATMEKWFKEGPPDVSEQNYSEFWEKLMVKIPFDEELAHRVAIRALQEAQKILARSRRVPRSNGADDCLQALLRLLKRQEGGINIPQQVRLLNAIYHSEIGESLLEPSGLSSYSTDWAWDQFIEKTDEKAKSDETAEPLIFEWLKELDQEEQMSLAVLLSSGLFDAKTQIAWRLEKHAKVFAEESPFLLELVNLSKKYAVWSRRKDEKLLLSARRSYLTLLKNETLAVALKVELISSVSREANFLHADNGVLQEILKIILEYGHEGRDLTESSFPRAFSAFSFLGFDLESEVGGSLVEVVEQYFLRPLAAQSRKAEEWEKLSLSIIRFALRSERNELAKKVVRGNYGSFRGVLELVLLFGEAGEYETLTKLFPSRTGVYDRRNVANYGQNFHALCSQILENVPEEPGYHLAVVCADRIDTTRSGVLRHEILREGRLEKLAKDFSEKGGALKGDARLEVLAILSTVSSSARHVEAELREYWERLTIADGFLFSENSSSIRRRDGFKLLMGIVQLDLEEKNFGPTRAKLTEFQKTVLGDGSDAWKLRYQADEVFGWIGRGLIQVALRGPEDALAALEEAKIYFDLAAQIKKSSAVMNAMDGAGLIISSLAGPRGDWKDFLNSHPEKKAYVKIAKSRSKSSIFSDLASVDWSDPSKEAVRAKILRALLDNSYYHEREISHVHDFSGLGNSRLFTIRDVIDVVKALPEEHPFKAIATFHIAALQTYRFGQKYLKEGMAAYDEAHRIALSAGNEVLANQIWAHRCEVFYKNGKKDEAKKDGPKVKPELLPKREQKWIRRALQKWSKG